MDTVKGYKLPGNFRTKIEGFSDILDKIVMWTGATLLVLMTMDILMGVFFRYVLNSSLVWSEEVARYMMIWMVSLAMSCGIKRDEHLTIRFLVDALPSQAAFWLEMAMRTILLGFLSVLTLYGVDMVRSNTDFISQAAEVNMAIPTSAVPVAGALMIIQLIINSILRFSQKNHKGDGGQKC